MLDKVAYGHMPGLENTPIGGTLFAAHLKTKQKGWRHKMAQASQMDLVAQLQESHQSKQRLCDQLEAIADGLPNNMNQQICATTARTIVPILQNAHAFEEQQLYPALSRLHHEKSHQILVIERLIAEHHEDRCFAEEVRDVLLAYGAGEPTQSPNATGYMLRGFFEGLRRHMAFEAELVRSLPHNKNGARH